MRNLVWTEGVFVASDFWKGVKLNFKNALQAALFFCTVLLVALTLVNFSNFLLSSGTSESGQAVMLRISMVMSYVFLALAAMMALWMIALGVVAILVAGGIAWYGYQLMQQKPIPQVQPVESTYTPADATAVVAPTDSVTMAVVTTEPAAKPVAATQEVQRMTSGHYYVVLGVFSTEENAKRAVAEAAKGADPLTCSIYYFGQKWMVSPATSALASETNAFRQAHSAAYPDLWVYQAK